ncbi:MAG: hypothetical protein SPL60_04345, partial [Lachnospiraceae bacterium]|nr:hypothetical protein [Lachnospiraceae bacterium]
QWLVAGRIAAGRGLAITYKMQVQQPTKTFCNFMQKRLAKNTHGLFSDRCKYHIGDQCKGGYPWNRVERKGKKKENASHMIT